MFLLLETTITATQWVLLALILALIVLYPIFTMYKNKKEREKFDNLASGLKVGDKVLTSSGIYGEIVAIENQQQGKLVTLKTGDSDFVGYISVDVLAIYTVFKDEPETPVNEEVVVEETPIVSEPVVEEPAVEEPAVEESVESVPAEKAKKPVQKKAKSTKKSQKK